MRKTRLDKIADIELQIEQLANQKALLLQEQKEQDRKARTKRLCERAGYLESILPDTIALATEQFKTFLQKTLLTDFARRELSKIVVENAPSAEPTGSGDTVQGGSTAAAKPTVGDTAKNSAPAAKAPAAAHNVA